MPFEASAPSRQSIAIIGGGISGLAAAHMLADAHRVVLFEHGPRLGGHARTVLAGRSGMQAVDTGFIVFNKVNYPHLTRLFDELEVPIAESNMSFGASIDGGRIEYALASLDTVFAQRRNALNPKFLRMLRDILHFNTNAPKVARAGMSIGDLLAELGTGSYFRDYYITPFSGAIWSTPTKGILDFPADAMMRFFENHRLLSADGQHQWYTVKGGSVEYVRRLETHLLRKGVDLRLKTPVLGVKRVDGMVFVRAEGGDWMPFDQVILATHSDDALALLSDASPLERAALGAVEYQPNEAVLHCDERLMPKLRKTWSSWAYVEPKGGPRDRIDLTYWMNNLQPIPKDDPLFVTLNGTDRIRPDKIYDQVTFRHPVYDAKALAAQKAIRTMNGSQNTWFCGAWMRNGFHEDGFASAVDVVQAMTAQSEPAMP